MAKNILILILTLLLCIASYLIYEEKVISIDIAPLATSITSDSYQNDLNTPQEINGFDNNPNLPLKENTVSDAVEKLNEMDGEIVKYIDPTIGNTIDKNNIIVTRYKAIGPDKFILLGNDGEILVQINLNSGNIDINKDHSLNDISIKFWKSIAKSYPEICFSEQEPF